MAIVMRLERRPWIAAAILLTVAFAAIAFMLQTGTVHAEGACPTGSPSGSPTDTGTPLPTDTGTPLPTDTGTPLPTDTPSLPGPAAPPRAVGAPEGDPTQPPDPCASSISLDATPDSGVWGTLFTLSGTLSCAGGGVESQTVTLKRKAVGANAFEAVTTGTTESGGAFSFTGQKPAVTTAYAVSFAGGALCDPALSPPVTVPVRPGVAFNIAANGTPDRGEYVTFAGKVAPGHPGQRVVLQVLQSGAWRNAIAVTLSSTSSYRVSYRRTGTGMLLFRLAYPTQHADHAWNVSRRLSVTWS
ncbi:MAG: hypothetical protein ACRDJM_03705, partial [Actinomycetota bacterium]